MEKKISWYRVFNSLEIAIAQIPLNQVRAIQAGNYRICIAHLPDGFFAIQDRCPHRDVFLSRGFVNAFDEVVCPWHNYRFNLKTGKRAEDYACSDAQTFPIRIDNKGFCIGVPE